MTIGAVAFAVLRRHFQAFLEHEGGCRAGEDIEELHKMRVATRRLRAAVRVFREYLPARAQAFRKTLKWIAGALGKVRDLDVRIQQERRWLAEASKEDRDAFKHVLDQEIAARRRARARMARVLDSTRYRRFVDSFTGMLLRGPSNRLPGRQSCVQVVPHLIEPLYRKVIRAGTRTKKQPTAENYHRLRIACKKLRYVLESTSETFEAPPRRLRKRLVGLQDVLGDYHDAMVGISRLRELATKRGRGLPTRVVYALGKMEERFTIQAEVRLKDFPRLFRRFKRCRHP